MTMKQNNIPAISEKAKTIVDSFINIHSLDDFRMFAPESLVVSLYERRSCADKDIVSTLKHSIPHYQLTFNNEELSILDDEYYSVVQ